MRAPSVYIEENEGSKPIEEVSTSTAGLVGLAQKGVNNKAILITSWTEFVQKFGRSETPHLAPAVWRFFENGGSRCFEVNTSHVGNPDPGVLLQCCNNG